MYVMCLCVLPVYHASMRVVRGRIRAGWLRKTGLPTVEPTRVLYLWSSQRSANARQQTIDFATIATLWKYVGQELCELNLNSRSIPQRRPARNIQQKRVCIFTMQLTYIHTIKFYLLIGFYFGGRYG